MSNLLADLQKYGKRYNSNDYKQAGFYGPIDVGNGNQATEYSVGQDINGVPTEMPSIVPNLTYDELQAIKQSAGGNGARLPDSVYQKAADNAKSRITNGKSPFWGIPEVTQQMPEPDILARLARGY